MSELLQMLTEFAAALDEADTVAEVWTLSCSFALEQGFDKVSYHAIRPSNAGDGQTVDLHIRTTGYPEDWLRHYLDDNLHLIDPITQRALASTVPFQWSDVMEAADLEPRGRQFVQELKAAGIGDGVALQAFGPNLRSAYIGLGFAEPPAQHLSRERLKVLSMAAQLAHLAVCRIDDAQVDVEVAQLSPRETEVLTLIAKGLSTVRIAEDLGVSRHTVDALQRRIYAKFDVTDRTSAVVHGLAAGVIQAPVVHAIRPRGAKSPSADPSTVVTPPSEI